MDNRPNVLWLSLESVRADHTSLYDYHRETTPHLERVSQRRDATVFTNGYAASIWTPASSASMLTGTHLSTHQVGRDGKGEKKLPSSIDTLPQLLASAGYDTALFSTNPYLSSDTGLDRGFSHSELLSLRKTDLFRADSLAVDGWRCALRRLKETPLNRINELKQEISASINDLLDHRTTRWLQNPRDSPFFAYAHIQSPHHPYLPVYRHLHSYTDEVDLCAEECKRISRTVYASSEEIKRRMANGLDLSQDQLEGIQAMYDAEIRYADHTANEIINAAQKAADGPLLIVVAGDHGDLFGERGLLGHNLALHEGILRVPMMIAGIEGIADGPNTMTQHIDLTKTIGVTCGIETNQFEGRDLRDDDRPHAISQRGIAHMDAYTKHNSEYDTSRFFENPVSAATTSDWKYVTSGSRSVLYSLPDEETDMSESNPRTADRLSKAISTEEIDWAESEYQRDVEFDTETRDRLQDLGYLS